MSEVNDLNEQVEVTVSDADVITVPIDATLSNSGEAADAKAVGDALALKADASSVVTIDVNDQEADNQGHIILTAANVPMSDDPGAQTVAAAINTATGKNATTIPMSGETGAQTISAKIGEMDGMISANGTNITALQQKAGDTILLETGGSKTIQAAVNERVKTVNGEAADAAGNVQVTSVALADNLNSSMNQTNSDAFVFRTSGGNISIKTGDAAMNRIKGRMKWTTAQQAEMTVTGSSITAALDPDGFFSGVASEEASGIKTFNYTTEWDTNPSGYGITVTGTPGNGDAISVTYNKGVIAQSNPQSFVSTGWNLYNHETGYAKVKKYTDNADAFGITGAYSAVKFSATLDGEKDAITVTNGKFNVITDGYVWVTDGNDTTTEIWMTWKDWGAQANGGVFETYTEDEIDLSDIMGNYFADGLLKAGSYEDEISLSTGKAVSRVGKVAFTAENLTTVKGYGTEYVYDKDYIYYGKTSETEASITISYAYDVNDHGNEYFTDTGVEVYAEFLYGNNLKNKLERDVLTISKQTLTSGEKAQVQENIGIAIKNDLTATTGGYVLDARQGKELNDKITQNKTVKIFAAVSGSLVLYRIGNTVFCTCTAGSYKNSAANGIYRDSDGNAIPAIPEGYRPLNRVEIMPTNISARTFIADQGSSLGWRFCFTDAQTSAIAVRFSSCWVTSDNYPT